MKRSIDRTDRNHNPHAGQYDSMDLSAVPPHTPDLLNLAALDKTTRRAVLLVIHRMTTEGKTALIHAHNAEAILDLAAGSLMEPLFPGFIRETPEGTAAAILEGYESQTAPAAWQLERLGAIAGVCQ